MDKKTKIAIIGAGQFGFYMAWYLGKNNFESVYLYDIREQTVTHIKQEKTALDLPKVPISDAVKLTTSLEECITDSEIIIAAVPAQKMRKATINFRGYINKDVVIVNVAKALELDTNKRMDEVFHDELSDYLKEKHNYEVVAIAGGMLAKEGVLGHRLQADVASDPIYPARRIRRLLKSDILRLKPTKDIVGVEIAGALKNIYAIGVGIYQGLSEKLGLGKERISTTSSLISESAGEGFDLAKRYVEEKNKKEDKQIKIYPATFGPRSQAWLADLITTCFGGRNSKFGKEIGEGYSPETAKDLIGTVEGYATTKVFYDILKGDLDKYPIFREIYLVLYEKKNPVIAMNDLMNAPHIPKRD